MSLRSTIHEIKTRDRELSEIASDRENFLSEWQAGVAVLYQMMIEMLEDLAAEGSVEYHETRRTVKEVELGEYEINEMVIIIANRAIVASPIARLISGGTGRVDLYRRDRPSEGDRIRLLRRLDPSLENIWFIEERPSKSPIDKFIYNTGIAALTIAGTYRNHQSYSKSGKRACRE